MDKIPNNMATFTQVLNSLKCLLVKDFGNLIKTITKGLTINTRQYKALHHQPKGITTNCMINKTAITTISHTDKYTLVGFKPHLIGKVVQPNFSSPSISSKSLSASLTKVRIKAKALYNKVSFANLKLAIT